MESLRLTVCFQIFFPLLSTLLSFSPSLHRCLIALDEAWSAVAHIDVPSTVYRYPGSGANLWSPKGQGLRRPDRLVRNRKKKLYAN